MFLRPSVIRRLNISLNVLDRYRLLRVLTVNTNSSTSCEHRGPRIPKTVLVLRSLSLLISLGSLNVLGFFSLIAVILKIEGEERKKSVSHFLQEKESFTLHKQ